MKKLIPALLFAALFLTFAACGDDKDEPEVPKTQNLTSVHEGENDMYFVFDIDMSKEMGTIYMYNIQFAGAPMTMNLRVNVPASLNPSGSAYIMMGTNLVCDMDMPSTGWVPMTDERYQLKNLTCTVNPKGKLYSISFDAHGGHFEDSGKLQ